MQKRLLRSRSFNTDKVTPEELFGKYKSIIQVHPFPKKGDGIIVQRFGKYVYLMTYKTIDNVTTTREFKKIVYDELQYELFGDSLDNAINICIGEYISKHNVTF